MSVVAACLRCRPVRFVSGLGRSRCAWLVLPALVLALVPARPVSAQSGWFVEMGGERSSVTDGTLKTIWSSEFATLGYRGETTGGWRASFERQTRGDLTDLVFTTGGYKRLGDWTIGGSAAGSPGSTFWFRRAFDAELSRRIVGGVVASVAYRYMRFPEVTVQQAQPALTWYHSRGEVQARLYVTTSSSRDTASLAMLLHASVQLNRHVGLSANVASGDRIFDIASLAYGPAPSWIGRAGIRLQLTRKNGIEIGGGYAHEDPLFTQRIVSLSYRRAF
jgi:YaiO family outer membrane protein